MAQDCDLRDHPIDAAHVVIPMSLMRSRCAFINDECIAAAGRKYHCPQGRRPADHPGQEAESLSIMPAHHAIRRPLVVANARHSPGYGCALRLDRPPSGALLGHARKTLSL
jgi:hypothetical protein